MVEAAFGRENYFEIVSGINKTLEQAKDELEMPVEIFAVIDRAPQLLLQNS